MFKKIIAFMLVLCFALCAFACTQKPDTDTDATTGNVSPTPSNQQADNNSDNDNDDEYNYPPVKLTNGWPSEGIFANVPPYKYAGELGQPIMPDTYLIGNSTVSNFTAYCSDLEAAGFVKSANSSEETITRYIYENAELNLEVTVAYWMESKEIEIFADSLDGSTDYSNKPTIDITWSANEYLSLLPEYTENGRIIDVGSSRKAGAEYDSVKIVDASFDDYNSYKAALLDAGFVQGNVAHEGWHTESYYYSHPDHPDFTAELYYELNGLSNSNIVIGITATAKAIV